MEIKSILKRQLSEIVNRNNYVSLFFLELIPHKNTVTRIFLGNIDLHGFIKGKTYMNIMNMNRIIHELKSMRTLGLWMALG